MQRLRVAFLWHFHQPDYRRGKIALLPWVRLHATKDYAELPAIHREFPSLRLTYNLTPILVEQLQEYAAGQLSDEHAVVASLPEHHCVAQPEHVIGWGFIGHAPRMIEPVRLLPRTLGRCTVRQMEDVVRTRVARFAGLDATCVVRNNDPRDTEHCKASRKRQQLYSR